MQTFINFRLFNDKLPIETGRWRNIDRNFSHVMRKPVYAICEQKGAGQPVHPRSLISAFIVRCLDSVIPLVSISEISSLYLASVAAQAGLSLTWSQTPRTGFLVTRLIKGNILYVILMI